MKRFQTLPKLKNKKYNLQSISQYGGANRNRSGITMHHQLLEKIKKKKHVE